MRSIMAKLWSSSLPYRSLFLRGFVPGVNLFAVVALVWWADLATAFPHPRPAPLVLAVAFGGVYSIGVLAIQTMRRLCKPFTETEEAIRAGLLFFLLGALVGFGVPWGLVGYHGCVLFLSRVCWTTGHP